MLRFSLSDLILVYLVLILGGIFVLWAIGEMLRSFRARRERRHQIVCRVCGFHFEDRSDEPLPRCPECGRLNEREPIWEI